VTFARCRTLGPFKNGSQFLQARFSDRHETLLMTIATDTGDRQ